MFSKTPHHVPNHIRMMRMRWRITNKSQSFHISPINRASLLIVISQGPGGCSATWAQAFTVTVEMVRDHNKGWSVL